MNGCAGTNTEYSTHFVLLYKVLKIGGVYMIHKSYGRDSGRCRTFTTAVVQQTITRATAVS